MSQKICLSRDVPQTSQSHLLEVFVVSQKHPTKVISCDFGRVIRISNNIDRAPLEALKKLNVFWEQCMAINQVCHKHHWANLCVRLLAASQRSSKLISRCIIYYLKWFFSNYQTKNNPLSETLKKLSKEFRN